MSNWPVAISFESKYDPYIRIATDEESFNLIGAAELLNRVEMRYFVPLKDLEKSLEQALSRIRSSYSDYVDLTEAELEALPGGIRAKAKVALEEYDRKQRAARRDLGYDIEDARLLQRFLSSDAPEKETVKDRRGVRNLAWYILENRKDYEYEGYSIENPGPAITPEYILETARSFL